MKTCESCKLELEESLFRKYTRKKCISCYKSWYREYENKNRDRIRNRQRKYQKDNEVVLKEKRKEYRELNKVKIKENYIKFINENPNYNTIYSRERYNNDDLFRLTRNYRCLLSLAFKKTKYRKNSNSQKVLGCSFEDFKLYLESKFEDWMNWENRGLYNGEFNYGWDIDHIIPLSSANSEEDIIKLSHYTNLQPLCSKVNRDIKKDSDSWEYPPRL
jgi:hypothetical protein